MMTIQFIRTVQHPIWYNSYSGPGDHSDDAMHEYMGYLHHRSESFLKNPLKSQPMSIIILTYPRHVHNDIIKSIILYTLDNMWHSFPHILG